LLYRGKAFIPVAITPVDCAEGPGDLAVAWYQFVNHTEGSFGQPVITKHPVLIITQSEKRLGRVWLEFLRILQRIFGHIGASAVNALEIKIRVRARKSPPGKRKIRVKLHRPFEITNGLQCKIGRLADASLERDAPQVRIVSLRVVRRFSCQRLLLATCKLCL
jgi:hypothetical protein